MPTSQIAARLRVTDKVGPRMAAAMTEVLAVATVATLVRRLTVKLPRPEQPLRITATSGPNPGKRFKVAVSSRKE